MRGKYDLVTRGPTGALTLWDWKTGRTPAPAYWEDFKNQQIQLGIYAVWMNHCHQTTGVKGTAVFLRDEFHEMSEVFTPAVERDVLGYLHAWRVRLNGLSSYPPIPSALCDWCGWNPRCRAYERRGRPRVLREPEEHSITSDAASKNRRKCFVATCVFENSKAPEVTSLRAYRDEVLSRSTLGQSIIGAYERIGPVVALVLQKTSLGKKVVRACIRTVVLPIVTVHSFGLVSA